MTVISMTSLLVHCGREAGKEMRRANARQTVGTVPASQHWYGIDTNADMHIKMVAEAQQQVNAIIGRSI